VGAIAISQKARFVQPALIDGQMGLVLAHAGHLSRVLRFTITNGKISQVEVIADPARLRQLDLAVVN
jgi:RNA polymerase sigma-70 factor (ECF subfamily)